MTPSLFQSQSHPRANVNKNACRMLSKTKESFLETIMEQVKNYNIENKILNVVLVYKHLYLEFYNRPNEDDEVELDHPAMILTDITDQEDNIYSNTEVDHLIDTIVDLCRLIEFRLSTDETKISSEDKADIDKATSVFIDAVTSNLGITKIGNSPIEEMLELVKILHKTFEKILIDKLGFVIFPIEDDEKDTSLNEIKMDLYISKYFKDTDKLQIYEREINFI